MENFAVHCKKEPYDVYIGRAFYGLPQSPFANPFIIGKDGDRDTVCDKFEQYCLERPELIKKIKEELKGKVLGCWCKILLSWKDDPKIKDNYVKVRCHGDFLTKVANEEI